MRNYFEKLSCGSQFGKLLNFQLMQKVELAKFRRNGEVIFDMNDALVISKTQSIDKCSSLFH
jgi:hypothetical protein